MLYFGKFLNCLFFDRRGECFFIINNFYKLSEFCYIYFLFMKVILESLYFIYYIILCRFLNFIFVIKIL